MRKELQELAENAALAGRRWRLIESTGSSLVKEIDRLVDDSSEEIEKLALELISRILVDIGCGSVTVCEEWALEAIRGGGR